MLTELLITPINTTIASTTTIANTTTSASTTAIATTTPKEQKHVFTCIKIPTNHINHTALYKTAENTGLLKDTAFKALFYHKPSRHPKDLTSREFDEVISKCVLVFDFKCYFVEDHTKTSTRYAIIYNRHDNNEDAIKDCTRKLKNFALKYRRHDEEYLVYSVYKLN